ncbi:MAG: hypothetical protein GY869_17945 [Planctomycetes bacterium]|nr:hypothetical protein [Planctomycetota bacterium]
MIGKGLARGSLVQFDRGSLKQLKQYIDNHPEVFADMQPAFEELQQAEEIYRNSTPDVTHNHLRLFTSGKLWSTMFQSAVNGWKVRNLVDEKFAQRLDRSKILSMLFFLLGLIRALGSPAIIAGVFAGLWTGINLIRGKDIPSSVIYFAVIAFAGGLIISSLCRFLRRLWARADYRRHYLLIILSWDYLKRAVRAKVAEKLIGWYRAGRISDSKALYLVNHPIRFLLGMPLGFLPAGLHRLITDGQFAREKLIFIFVRPLRLYFNAELREQWLRDMVTEGQKNHTLTEEDAGVILGQLHEPFIQKYLKSLAVHVCTLPVTQVVSIIIAAIYYFTHLEDENAWKVGIGIIGLFQVVPISPGSICRGAYVVYLVIRERNFKDYNIAVFLGFFKYVGYLAFPIQMAYRYPVLARFMAAHWATGAVHVVPVFGEQGALLEHGIFGIFYNLPLTIRRRMKARTQLRSAQKARYIHGALCAIAAAVILILFDGRYVESISDDFGAKNILTETWWLVLGLPLATGAAITLGAGGASLARRIIQAALSGLTAGLFYILIYAGLKTWQSGQTDGAIPVITQTAEVAELLIWRVFTFCIFSVIAALLTELSLPEPQMVDRLNKNEVVIGKMAQ